MDPQRAERRLAAIMFTDIVGSTALMAHSEAEGLRAKEQHRALVRPLVERYHGECIEAKGDESLSVFPSALDAVNCALAIEAELVEMDLKLHIGIHLGDISLAKGEISGDGVNIASRVCALSEGGGLCVSDEVYQAVRNQPEIDMTSLGERELKNVGRPVPVFRLSGPAAAPSRRRAPRGPIYLRVAVALVVVALAVTVAWLYQAQVPGRPTAPGVAGLADRPAIAVLPFENLTGDPEQSMFADGLAEDLITRLGSWRSFPVIPRQSSFNPDLPKDVQRAGVELRAHYVVAGSVRKAGERIRINVQLIDTESGRQVWANQYDRDFNDVLGLQDEITQTIIGEVNPDLLQFESARAMHQESSNLDAWTLAMQGWWHFNQFDQEHMAQAVELFERSAALDPQFGYAYAGLALAHFRTLALGWSDSPERTVGELVRAAETAVSLEEFGAEAHHALGHAFAVTGQTDRMIGAFELGVEFNPSDAMANNCYGAHLAWVGRGEDAIDALTRAMSISPRDPWAFEFRVSMAWAYFAIEEYEQAIEWAEKSIQRGPNFMAYQVVAASQGQLGQLEQGGTSLQELRRLQPDLSIAAIEAFFAPANPDFRDRMVDGLRKAGLEA